MALLTQSKSSRLWQRVWAINYRQGNRSPKVFCDRMLVRNAQRTAVSRCCGRNNIGPMSGWRGIARASRHQEDRAIVILRRPSDAALRIYLFHPSGLCPAAVRQNEHAFDIQTLWLDEAHYLSSPRIFCEDTDLAGLGDGVRSYRLGLMREFMRKGGYDALAFTSPDWFEWAGNHGIRDQAWERPYVLIVPANGPTFAIMSDVGRLQLRAERQRNSVWIDSITHYGECPHHVGKRWMSTQWPEIVADALKTAGLSGAKIGADGMTSPLAQVSKHLSGLTITAAGSMLRSLRWVKHADEIATMRASSSLSDWTMDALRAELRPGRLLAGIDYGACQRMMIEAARRFAGENFTINKIITLCGPSSACTHGDGALTGKVVEPNTVCVTTISTKLRGLTTELTRTWLIGLPDRNITSLYDTTLAAHDASLEAAVAGRAVSDIQAAARTIFERAGVIDSFFLRSAHGIGVVMHEFPHNVPLEDRLLLANETFNIEPGLSVEGVGGFRSADTVVIGTSAPQELMTAPRDRASQTLK
jgi:Xaa-Pro aminopeptidase